MSLNGKAKERPVSRRSFIGTIAATLSVGATIATLAFGQSATKRGKRDSHIPTDESTSIGLAKSSEACGSGISTHVISLTKKQPYFAGSSGSLASLDVRDMPRLSKLSIRRLVLAPRGVREPHWHANAHELAYCLRGEHLVTIVNNHGMRNCFAVSPGEAFFVPSGAIHHIENIGSEEGEMILAFSHEQPEEFGISGTFGCFTDAVLGNSVGLPAEAFSGLTKTRHDTVIGSRSAAAVIELQEKENSPFKYPLGSLLPQISSPAGSARTAQLNVWPILQDLAMFSIGLTDRGMRELHWHPETAEMGYITTGRGRMTIVSPGGTSDTFELGPGDVYFIPRAYPHHFEDIGAGDFKLLVFFDRIAPGDIGVRTAIGCFSRDVLAAAFNVAPSALPTFPLEAHDPLIVPRINPVG